MGTVEFKPGNMLYPVPVVMVSCGKEGEKANIITIAWTGTINSDPPCLSVSIRPSRHSYDIIKETGEFVVNLPTKELTYATDWCGVKSGRDFDKFKEMNLTELASTKVKCPGIAESPVRIECKVKQIVPLGTHDMFVAEIVGVTVDDKYMDADGKFHFDASEPICYSHGEYWTLGQMIGKFGYSVKKDK